MTQAELFIEKLEQDYRDSETTIEVENPERTLAIGEYQILACHRIDQGSKKLYDLTFGDKTSVVILVEKT